MSYHNDDIRFVDIPPSMMQRGSPETDDNNFKEMMHSAFLRGVELLSAPESNSVQSQGRSAENSRKFSSEHMEGIDGVPKNVTELKPVIDKLMCKDLPKGADKEWLSKAKEYTQWARKNVSVQEDALKYALEEIERVALKGFQEDSLSSETDKS